MRNWNKSPQWNMLTCANVLPDYLWGIETTRWIRHSSKPLHASRLPMRNWNSSRELRPRSLYSELPDYLWGIETRLSRLRPWHPAQLPDYLWGIETGFAEIEDTSTEARFQTTYEELKLQYTDREVRRGKKLPDYLWGIETEFIHGALRPPGQLPDYLWGIETRPKRITSSAHKSSFQTTYEELKLGQVGIVDTSSSGLPDYLWGIETGKSEYSHTQSRRFQTTYEELKLGCRVPPWPV